MKNRSKLAHELSQEDKIIDDQEAEQKIKDMERNFKKLFFEWISVWVVVIVIIFYLSRSFWQDYSEFFNILGVTLIVIPVILIGTSAIASTRLVIPGMLVVQGTGAMEDMIDSKRRGFEQFGGPFIGFVLGIVALIISFILS